jgi:predicted aconitase with swiveling domain
MIHATPLVAGAAVGEALVTREPLSFWGGYDFRTGEIIDRRHPLSGEKAAGRILVLPYARGSSTTTAILLEALRAGTAPAAILTTGPETFFALAAIVAEEIFGLSLPVFVVSAADLDELQTGMELGLSADGTIRVRKWTNADHRA